MATEQANAQPFEGDSAATLSAESPPPRNNGAFPRYSDEELQRLIADIRRFDGDGYVSAAHSAAVVD